MNVTTVSTTRIRAAATVQPELERGVAADLGGLGAAAAAAVAHQRPDQRALDDQEDHDRDVERDLVERVDVVRVRRTARFRGEGVRQRGRGRRPGGRAAPRPGGEQSGVVACRWARRADHICARRGRSTSCRPSQVGWSPLRFHLELAHPQAVDLELLDAQLPDHRALRSPAARSRPRRAPRAPTASAPIAFAPIARAPMALAPTAMAGWRPPHAPWNAGSRFSRKASAPSWKSRVRARACWSSASSESWPSRSG